MRACVEIFDLDSGRSHVVLDCDRHVEAPNWAPSGDWLLVNAEGRLYRIDLDDPALVALDTGPCITCNNDHGISPDGRQIVLSDHSLGEGSCIHVVDAGGGDPRRLTDHVPSWWHGWSPDGSTLAYTCVRAGHFGIATLAADGGDETVLLSSPHHYDGPDYTPDGQWIWFNSDRAGTMDLWRMKPDGSALERMTHGASVDWFPHPSPDGSQVLFLAYPPGTTGHPFGRHVQLCLMPAAGGAARVLLDLFGGQGTLNVPCWAPDGRRFAFVRYFENDQP
ncbi:TolB family protein [Marinibacterium sp. SX1]|uniref:TolB family protein n=1 Tax=Marinibacterium sp. SX1 TaxID=3388424 RepID=UPI003D1732E1